MTQTRRAAHNMRRKTRRSNKLSPMRSSYGELVLRKGTVLYHTSPMKFGDKPAKPMLFLTFHPSEWYRNSEDYVTSVELTRAVSLFFMVNELRNMRIFSALNVLIERPGENLSKMKNTNLDCYKTRLQQEGFDGWFSTIENKTAVEVALINDPSIYKVISCNPIVWNWGNSRYNTNGEFVPKNWGITYSLSTQTNPAILRLNSIFKPKIEKYMADIERDEPDGTAFYMVLKNATITYVNATIQKIQWC